MTKKKSKRKDVKNGAPCISEALKIQKKDGGRLYIIGKFPSQNYWHVVVKKNNKFYDATGEKTLSQIKKKYPSQPIRCATKRDKKYLKKINPKVK